MSAEEKKRKLIEKELRKLGINDQELLEKLIDQIDSLAKIIIESYKNERNNLL